MFKVICFAISCALLVFTEAAYVDSISKCGIQDNECQSKFYQATIQYISENGIEELGIPKADPLHLQNISVAVGGIINITLIDGEGLGLKSCVINHFESHIEKGTTTFEVDCNIKLQGKYRVSSDSGIIKKILGEITIHGEGKGIVEIDKLRLHLELNYDIKKGDNDKIYLMPKKDHLTYTYEILGKTTFDGDNLYIGSVDVVKPVVAILNENSNFIMKVFGKDFLDTAMELASSYSSHFFSMVSADHYISDDLTEYLN